MGLNYGYKYTASYKFRTGGGNMHTPKGANNALSKKVEVSTEYGHFKTFDCLRQCAEESESILGIKISEWKIRAATKSQNPINGFYFRYDNFIF